MEKNESAKRKGMPLFQGCFMYFPDALLAVAEHSRKANDKHNPGEPLHWSKDKSKDHADCIARHLLDIGPKWDAIDPEFQSLHATALAWRALALLQTVLERPQPLGTTELVNMRADGWIPWKGGVCPVDRDLYVLTRLRNGFTPLVPVRAGYLEWKHFNGEHDLLAYKVA